MSEYFDTITKPRIQKVVYSDTWKNGKPVDRAGTSHMFKYVRLESYEDTLNNLTMTGNALSRQMEQEQVGSDLHADYMLTYMLDAETASSSVFLGADIFRRPFSQIMRISTGSVGHSEGRLIDVVETFNYLIGLRVHKCFSYNADTLRVISGTTNTNNQRVIVIWRDLEELNDENIWDFLSGHMETIRQLNEAAIIYINGDSTGGRLVDPKKLRIIDGEFKRLMFDDRNVE
jgi:adenine-specific DNA-methyltransferase